ATTIDDLRNDTVVLVEPDMNVDRASQVRNEFDLALQAVGGSGDWFVAESDALGAHRQHRAPIQSRVCNHRQTTVGDEAPIAEATVEETAAAHERSHELTLRMIVEIALIPDLLDLTFVHD